MNDFIATLVWWLVIQFLSLTAVPLAFRLFRWLPDRGYTLSKAMGVLLTSYLFWLLGSLGFLRNSAGGILFAAGAVALFSVWVYGRKGAADEVGLRAWLRENVRLILTAELLFALAFGLWALVRAHNPNITATEKPMDLAFINAVGRSGRFPPLDPWLSGFAISYYYFGYLMTAAVAKLSGVSGSVAFNLGLAWQFAGTLLGGFGLVYNLVAASKKGATHLPSASHLLFGLLGSLLVGVMGNLEGFLEVLHVNAILPAGFWKWLDIQEINLPPPATPTWPPRGNWWWWRTSRVIHDRWLDGESMGLQPIDEFPFFSFLLGDMHPHVLALPFVFLALGLALNWWLKRWQPDTGSDGSFMGWVRGFIREADPVFLALYAVCLGALGFLNTWDFPFYLFVTVGALTLAQLRARGPRGVDSGFVVETWLLGGATLVSAAIFVRNFLRGEPAGATFALALVLSLLTAGLASIAQRRWQQTGRWELGLVGQTLLVGGGLLAAGVLAYLPFYIGFRSQAGGILPNVINPTWLPQFFVMFGPFLFILVVWLIDLARGARISWKVFLGVTGGLLALLLVAASVLGAAAAIAPQSQGAMAEAVRQMGSMAAAMRQTLLIRLTNPWTALFLLAMIGSVVALWQSCLGVSRKSQIESPTSNLQPPTSRPLGVQSPITPFVLLLVLTAALLTLAPEFVYLKDNFGARLNTVFKFYYQAWVMFAIASGYALYALLRKPNAVRWVAGVGATVLIAAGLFYPALAIPTRTNNFSGEATLDGMAYMATSHPADYAAIHWLQENVSGTPVILEAVGGQYSWGGRISVHTGLPTLLGWAGHELQWRGFTPEPGIREPDIKEMYTSHSWPETQALLDKYQVEYVIVGPLESSTYGLMASTKFERVLEPVFQADGVTIYKWNNLTE